MAMQRPTPLFGVLLAFLVGCPGFGSPPEAIEEPPSWDESVADLMGTKCAICHTDPPQGGAPTGFRFDKYTTDDIDDGGLLGAFEMRERIEARAVVGGTMPPASVSPLSGAERSILDEWITIGAPREESEAAQ